MPGQSWVEKWGELIGKIGYLSGKPKEMSVDERGCFSKT